MLFYIVSSKLQQYSLQLSKAQYYQEVKKEAHTIMLMYSSLRTAEVF